MVTPVNNLILFELFTCLQGYLFELCLNYAVQLKRDTP